MRTRIVVNAVTGETETIPIDNAWVLANRPSVLELSITQSVLLLGQSATLTAQLKTPELADFSQNNLSENREISLQIGDVITSVNLVNGAWSDTLIFAYAGAYRIECLSLSSNIVEVVVA